MSAKTNHQRPGKGLFTEISVGESIALKCQIGGSELVFHLDSKHSIADLSKEFERNPRSRVDSAKIVLTIETRHGQRARVNVQADETIQVKRPDKITA